MTDGLIFDIRRFSVHDGPGIRTTVFLKGCPLNCLWCHNPEGRFLQPEKSIRKRVLDGKTYQQEEITGKRMATGEIMTEIPRDHIFFEESGGGVTFSGGEPLMQPEFLADLLTECRKAGLHTAVDTCGFAEKAVIEKIVLLTDLFLFDLKLIDETEHIKFTGVSNKLILENFVYLVNRNIALSVRFPIIPAITDTAANIDLMLKFLTPYSGKIGTVHLLPYHSFAKGKYERLGKEFHLDSLGAPDKAAIDKLIKTFSAAGFMTKFGG